MAVFAPIPLPGNGNEVFKDVMDYFEEIQKRKALGQQAAEKLRQDQSQFDVTNQLDREKLKELSQYHKDLLRAKIEEINSKKNGMKQLSAQERNEAMKIRSAARALKSLYEKTHKIRNMLYINPNLTGWFQGAKYAIGKGEEDTSTFATKTGDIQSAIGRVASSRPGAQVIGWAGKYKPAPWKSHESNVGMSESLMDDAESDFNQAVAEYEDLTGKPLNMSLTPRVVFKKVIDHKTGKITIMPEKEANELTGKK